MSSITFGQRLRRLRHARGFSQSELEARSGIPKSRLSRYENDHLLPSIQTLSRLATALGLSQAVLLGDQPHGVEEFVSALLERGVQLDDARVSRALGERIADMVIEQERRRSDGSIADVDAG